MLDTQGLRAAGVDESKNPLLQGIWSAVQIYNRQTNRVGITSAKFDPAGLTHLYAKASQQVMIKCGLYLTSKPPKTDSDTNTKRWDAIADLAAAVSVEADRLGFKLVAGPDDFDFRNGFSENYWLEVLDPFHREGQYLKPHYNNWLADGEARNQSFWDYGGGSLEQAREKMRTDGGYEFVDYDLAANSLVEFKGSKLHNIHGEVVDTSNMESFRGGGDGWGIFVLDTQRQMFVTEHKGFQNDSSDDKWVRHTSLAAGSPVIAAGEIQVEQGIVRKLSNDTGHYLLPANLLLQFICQCWQIPGDCVAKVRFEDKQVRHATCTEIRSKHGDADKINWQNA